jgi:hypothetical protein
MVSGAKAHGAFLLMWVRFFKKKFIRCLYHQVKIIMQKDYEDLRSFKNFVSLTIVQFDTVGNNH